VEIAIAMLAQESSPHNTFETSTSFATFSVFALPGCTVQSLPFLLTALLAVAEESGEPIVLKTYVRSGAAALIWLATSSVR
jgi:hypothetical protein